MWRTIGTILIIALGCVVFPILVIGSLLLPQDDPHGWRPIPPPR